MPRHPEAYKLYKEGFFTGLKSFRDFEASIDARIPVPDPSDETPLNSDSWSKKKGDVFEVFAEAYLVLKKGYQYQEVWPFSSSPFSVKNDLNIPSKDKGIDIIAVNRASEVHNFYDAIQVKYRSGRRPISYAVLGTFFGLADSPKIGAKILFTNSEIVSSDAEARDKYQKIGPAQLDALTEDDFRLIEEYISTGKIGRLQRPRDLHQEEAVKALTDELGKASRAQAVMACGTGKTMVCMWTAEELGARAIVVFLPSLALISQTMHEWTQYTSIPRILTLCVCSDDSVAADAESDDVLTDEQRDLDFKVTTSSEEVTRFLRADFSGVKIVFSTYKSAKVLSSGMPAGFCFDFGIFDEAHKTVGLVNKEYAFALSDKNLPIAKRLFATATPRRRKAVKGQDGLVDEVYSMHDAEVYGRRAYYLPFNEAAKRGIICRYKVLVTVITSDEISDKVQSGSLSVDVDGLSVSGGSILSRFALESAIKKSNARKVITFHQRIADAAAFASFDDARHGAFFPGFIMAHVSGKMRSDRRKAVIDSFRDSKLGILTNARCLTEGVDLPAVDMVAFLSRRKSRVDIIQAIGRCLRKPRPNRENKDTGYVLVPLFVKLTPGMALLDAIESAGYDEIWDVLNALADHDDSLEAAVRRESVDRSRYKIPKFSVLRDYVEVISSLGEIRDAVSSKCMEGLQLAWDDYYGRLLAFFDAHNHIKVPNDTLENRELVQWMYEQRSRRSKGLMSEEDVRKLDVVGFVWDKFDAQWNLMYAKAKSFKDANGHFDVPVVDAQSQTLSTWISRQRSKFRSGSLPDLQKGMLDEIGFNWEVLEERWVDSFEQLNSFYSMNGHCRLPAGSEYDALNTWCKNQRQNYRKGKLSADRIAKLEGIKFIWNALDAAWMDFYDHLVAYQKVHSHCNVPEGYNAVPGLSSWVSNNRNKPPRDPERLKLLNDIGFVFSVHDKAWEEMVRRLIAYKDTHGDCAVPAIYPLDPKLGKWVSNVRVKARKGKLSDARNAQLSAIGFAFVVKASPSTYKSWDESFAVLSSYHALTGGVDVPADYSEAPWLPKWIHRQREQKIKGLLTVDQIARLDGIGFIWDVLSAQWDANFALLAEFKSLKNNCRVPHGYPENPALALWVKRQRKAYREGKLSLERIARLNSLNFEWVA